MQPLPTAASHASYGTANGSWSICAFVPMTDHKPRPRRSQVTISSASSRRRHRGRRGNGGLLAFPAFPPTDPPTNRYTAPPPTNRHSNPAPTSAPKSVEHRPPIFRGIRRAASSRHSGHCRSSNPGIGFPINRLPLPPSSIPGACCCCGFIKYGFIRSGCNQSMSYIDGLAAHGLTVDGDLTDG